MPLFTIRWGFQGGPLLLDVVEAADEIEAIRMSDELAEDLWESNKIIGAKPFRDKDDNGQPRPDNLSGNGVMSDLHAVGCGAGGGEVTS